MGEGEGEGGEAPGAGRWRALVERVAAAALAGHGRGAERGAGARARAAREAFARQGAQLLKRVREKGAREQALEEEVPFAGLRGHCFVGHVRPDTDAIASAVGAAELFGGVACRAEVASENDLNGEILYSLEVAGLPAPPLFDATPGAGAPPEGEGGSLLGVCLVDHNEPKQMPEALRGDLGRVVGLIDHHALSIGFNTLRPICIDVRPWGSASTILAHISVITGRSLSPPVARLLLCGVLSDTLNLQSPTTCDADRLAVPFLAQQGGVTDPDAVAAEMFSAKTRWTVSLGPYEMCRGVSSLIVPPPPSPPYQPPSPTPRCASVVRLTREPVLATKQDQKDFEVDGWKFGISVLEVTDPSGVMEVAEDLLLELRILKKEKGCGEVQDQLDFCFLFVVDIVRKESKLLLCGGREYALAREAFNGCEFRAAAPGLRAPGTTISAENTLCDVGPLVSRKAQFVPAFSKVLAEGFSCHRTRVTDPGFAQGPSGAALDRVLSSGRAAVTASNQSGLLRDVAEASAALFSASSGELG